MSTRTRWGLTLAFCLTLLIAGIASRIQPVFCGYTPYTWVFPAMGTVARFVFYARNFKEADAARHAALREFNQVGKLCNLYDENSELSRLNRKNGRFNCSLEFWELLIHCRNAYWRSQGNFDVSIKPLMDLWGFYRKQNSVPDREMINKTLKRVGLDKVEFIPETQTIRFTVPDMALDLGGIAKGYALDRAAAAAVKNGIKAGVLDLGGNLRFLPQLPPGKKCYRIGVRDPRYPGGTLPEVLELPADCAVSTSGDYERFVTLNGVRYGHIISPKTGIPQTNFPITAVADTALNADWISTAVYLGNAEFVKKFKQHNSTTVYRVKKRLEKL